MSKKLVAGITVAMALAIAVIAVLAVKLWDGYIGPKVSDVVADVKGA